MYDSKTVSLYIDGFEVTTKTFETPGVVVTMDAPVVGAFQFLASSYANHANMVVHSVRAWSEKRDGR